MLIASQLMFGLCSSLTGLELFPFFKVVCQMEIASFSELGFMELFDVILGVVQEH